MNPAIIEIVGSAAACFTTAAFFPQAFKTIRQRHTAGLSLSMYLLLVTGVGLWLLYGVMIGSWPLIVANGIVILPQLTILALLLRQSWRDDRAGLPVSAPGGEIEAAAGGNRHQA